jgi:hypothetical protein
MNNVPTGVWVDEDGRIVRLDEDAYSKKYTMGNFSFGNDVYRPAVRDWVENGEKSRYVQPAPEIASHIGRRSEAQARADAAFKLGVYFFELGNKEKANLYWDEAQRLRPESWNYHRQDWSFLPPQETQSNWWKKFQALEGKPYYRPLELEAPPP